MCQRHWRILHIQTSSWKKHCVGLEILSFALSISALSLLSIFTKERSWANQKPALSFITKEQLQWLACDSSDSHSKSEWFARFSCFWQFFPLFMPIEWITSVALRSHFSSLFFKDQRDRFTNANFLKRATVSKSNPSIFKQEPLRSESVFRSFDHKKRAIHLKNWCSNSQPCLCVNNHGWEFAHQFLEQIARVFLSERAKVWFTLFFEQIPLLLFFKEQRECIDQGRSFVMSDRSNSLKSLFKKSKWEKSDVSNLLLA